MGGGYFSRDEDWECPGGVFAAHSIEIVPDPSPILQQAGYGGTFRDPDDRSILYVRLVNPSQEAAEEAAHRYVSPYLLKKIREIRPLKAPYSIEQLEMWHESTGMKFEASLLCDSLLPHGEKPLDHRSEQKRRCQRGKENTGHIDEA